MEYVNDWTDRLTGKVPSQLRSKPNAQGHLAGLAKSYQAVEDLVLEVKTGTSLGLATGVILDRYAALVGQQRGDLTDPELRRFIQARVIANISDGQPNSLIQIATLAADATAVWYRPDPMGVSAFFSLYILRPNFMRETLRAECRRVLEAATPAGVVARFVEVPMGFDGMGPLADVPAPFAPYGPAGVGAGLMARKL